MFEGTCEWLSSVVFMCKLKKRRNERKKTLKTTYKKYQKNQKTTKVPLRVSFLLLQERDKIIVNCG